MPVLLGKLHKAWRLLQCLALPAHRQTRFDHRTKTEHRATILLPNPVAAHDTKPDVMDGPAKFLKENRTAQNRSSPAKTALTAFRVRCMSEKLLDTTGKGYSTPPIDNA
jgi:hypothetical protein